MYERSYVNLFLNDLKMEKNKGGGVKAVLYKAMHSVKRYISSAKNPEFRVIPTSVNTVINVRIPLR